MLDSTYNKGQVVEVVVTGIAKFGAFVSLEDGSTGLIQISEISDCYIQDISSFLKVGEKYKAMIIGKGEKENTYQLSIKKLLTRRPRQNISNNVKPLTRRQLNKEKIKEIPFDKLKNDLDESILREYERNKNNSTCCSIGQY